MTQTGRHVLDRERDARASTPIVARADGGPSGGGTRPASQPLVVAGEEVNVVLTTAPAWR